VLSDHLVSTAWLAERLQDPDLRVVDMRGHLTWEQRHQEGLWQSARKDYETAHIPGAVYLDFTSDLVDTNDPVPLQVAPLDKLKRVLGKLGIGDDHLVVAYDADRSIFATRLWWIFRLCGHTNLRVLDGGWPKWRQEARPVSADVPEYPSATFSIKPNPGLRVAIDDVIGDLGSSGVALVDGRIERDFLGYPKWVERGGHIPGAINIPGNDLLRSDGTFRPVDELRSIFAAAGLPARGRVVAYCGLGLSATAVAFALDIVGVRDVSVYDGSWAEWGSRKDLPVA
jgi:thiosulfate/3-mercaptopyruvate sulfurtransferase